MNEIRISLGNHSEAIKTQVRIDKWFLVVSRKKTEDSGCGDCSVPKAYCTRVRTESRKSQSKVASWTSLISEVWIHGKALPHNKVESDRGRQHTSAFGLNTHASTHACTHTHMPQKITVYH